MVRSNNDTNSQNTVVVDNENAEISKTVADCKRIQDNQIGNMTLTFQ